MKPFSRHLLQLLLGALILHVLWLGGYYLIASEVLPAPWTVYAHLLRMDGSSLLTHALVSLERMGDLDRYAPCLSDCSLDDALPSHRAGALYLHLFLLSYP